MTGARNAAGLALVGLSLIAVCYGLARFAYGLFVPVLREEFGLDGSTVGAIAASSYAGYCVAILAAMLLTARFGARSVAVAAGIAATLGTATIAAADSAAVLAAGVVIAGSSTGLASPPLADAVARTVTPGRRDRVQTVVNAGTGLGVMVSGPVALLTRDSWRLAWWSFAVVAAVVTAWVVVAVPGRTVAATGAGEPRWPRPLLPPGSARLMAAATLMGLASAPVWTFGRDIAISAGELGERTSTGLWIVLGAAGLLAAFTGHLIARIGLAAVWAGGMVALAAATTAFAVVAGSPTVLFAAAAVFGAVYIALTGVLLVWGTLVHPVAPAVGVGVAFLMIAVGQGIGSPLTGAVSDLTTLPTAFLLAAAVAAVGALVVPRTLSASAPDAQPRTPECQHGSRG